MARERLWGYATVALLGAGLLDSRAAAAQGSREPPAEALEEITVTATKRSETLQAVPMSISALSSEQIAMRGAQSLQELSGSIPALSFRSSGPGREKLTLRGISSSAGVAPTVSFYVDEAPLASSSSASNTSFQQTNADPDLFDIERIEVLRGPQGTLYGSSSLGGTVRIITRQPNAHEFESRVNAEGSETAHGGFNWTTRGVVNLPLVEDRLALRISGSAVRNSGFIDRLVGDYDATGHINGPLGSDVVLPTRQLPAGATARRISDVNDNDVSAVRAALRFEPFPGLYFQPSVFWQKIAQGGKSSYDSVPGTLEQRRAFDVPEPYADRFVLSNLTAGYSFTGAKLLSSTSYMDRNIGNTEDWTDGMSYFFGYSQDPNDLPAQRLLDTTGRLWDLSTAPFPGRVVPTAAPMTEVVRISDFTQELRLTSADEGPFDWIAGVYYKHSRSLSGYNLTVPGYSATFPAYGTLLGGTFGDTFAAVQSGTSYREVAAFGEASYAFTDQWKVTLGARWFDYRSDFDRTTQGLFFGRPTPGTVEAEASGRGVSPKALLSYTPFTGVQLYASASRGYRPGATNTPVPVGRCDADLAALGLTVAPEKYGADALWSYELGVKSSPYAGRLTANAALYWIDWKDIQQKIFLPNCGALFTNNAGTARSRGAELEIQALVVPDLRIGAGAGYNDAKFTTTVPYAGVQSGDRLTDAPRWTLNASLEWSFGHWWQGQQFVRVGWSYIGASLDTQAVTSVLDGHRTPGIEKDPFSMTDARVGFRSDLWEGSVFVKNAFDQRADLTQVDTLGQLTPLFSRIVTNQPRTVGLSVTRRF